MKLLSSLWVIVLLTSIAQSDNSIDTQIDQVMQAPASERMELMNQLKTKLATMNSRERKEALQKLSSTISRPMNIGQGMSGKQGLMIQNSPSQILMNFNAPMPQSQMNTAGSNMPKGR